MINEMDARRSVRRLLDVFSTSKTEEKLVKAITIVFDGEPFSAPDLMAATTWFLKSDASYMPTAGKLLSKARELAGQGAVSAPREWSGYSEHDGACGVCGAEPRWLEPGEQVNFGWDEGSQGFVNMAAPVESGLRYGTLHDLKAHRLAGVASVGYWR